MKKLVRSVVGILVLSTASLTAVYAQSLAPGQVSHASQQKQYGGRLSEEFSFLINDFKIDHQGEVNTLNISITYRYRINIANSDYPDFRWLAKDVETLLSNYPNKADYWEIVNKQITALLMKKYPALSSLTCEVRVSPSPQVPYTRSSRVTRDRKPFTQRRKGEDAKAQRKPQST